MTVGDLIFFSERNTASAQKEDEAELRQVRWQARRVILKGLLVALPLTVLAYLLPI